MGFPEASTKIDPTISSQAEILNNGLSGGRITVTKVGQDSYQLKYFYWFNPFDWYREWKYGDVRSEVIQKTMGQVGNSYGQVDPRVKTQLVRTFKCYWISLVCGPDKALPSTQSIRISDVALQSLNSHASRSLKTQVAGSLSDEQILDILSNVVPSQYGRDLVRLSGTIDSQLYHRIAEVLLNGSPGTLAFIQQQPDSAREVIDRLWYSIVPEGLGQNWGVCPLDPVEVSESQWHVWTNLIWQLLDGHSQWTLRTVFRISELTLNSISNAAGSDSAFLKGLKALFAKVHQDADLAAYLNAFFLPRVSIEIDRDQCDVGFEKMVAYCLTAITKTELPNRRPGYDATLSRSIEEMRRITVTMTAADRFFKGLSDDELAAYAGGEGKEVQAAVEAYLSRLGPLK